MTNNHLYWTVTTILQEQSGTHAEIIKHMIKIASVLSCLNSVVVYPIVICYVSMLFVIFLSGYSAAFLRIFKGFKKLQYNVCYTKVLYIYSCVYVCTVIF